MSQLELAFTAAVSSRHVSFIEIGRAAPSRDMVLHLASQLDLPLRERNRLLQAAGFAPAYAERPLASAPMAPVRDAVRQLLAGHEPYPATVLDRRWNVVDRNAATDLFTEGVAVELLQPPINVMRLCLHPGGLAPRIVGLGAYSSLRSTCPTGLRAGCSASCTTSFAKRSPRGGCRPGCGCRRGAGWRPASASRATRSRPSTTCSSPKA